MTREEYIAGLRAVADWMVDHPDVPGELYGLTVHISSGGMGDDKGIKWIEAIAAAAQTPPTTTDHHLSVRVDVASGVTYEAMHVWDRVMADHDERMAYARGMQAAVVPA